MWLKIFVLWWSVHMCRPKWDPLSNPGVHSGGSHKLLSTDTLYLVGLLLGSKENFKLTLHVVCQELWNPTPSGDNLSILDPPDYRALKNSDRVPRLAFKIMTSSHGDAFRIAGPLWGDSLVTDFVPSQRVNKNIAMMFSLLLVLTSC